MSGMRGVMKQSGCTQALKEAGVEVIVAPYEADAQMAFLAKSRSVHAVITEDSDLLTYGCPRVSIFICVATQHRAI